ncbi:MAG: hypothetical protein IT168_26055 [Bryobacterales bacterium]|nr:hypothetical protein [Bryobacterales bacterium]
MPATGKIPFDPNESTLETVRQIVFSRLRTDREWHQLGNAHEFDPFIEYITSAGWVDGRPRFAVLFQEMFWQLVCEGILSPGYNASNDRLPFFHITDYGRQVLTSTRPLPYDPAGYLQHLQRSGTTPDRTVTAYLAESLETFRKGNLVASTVMLGIAAERVFLLLCEDLEPALADPREKAELSKRLKAFPMKPKLDWVHEKIQRVQNQRPAGFPENATIMTVAIYDLLRCQRNELGHPREVPPNVTREDAFVNLQIFPRYFTLAEEVRNYLKSHSV